MQDEGIRQTTNSLITEVPIGPCNTVDDAGKIITKSRSCTTALKAITECPKVGLLPALIYVQERDLSEDRCGDLSCQLSGQMVYGRGHTGSYEQKCES